MSSGDALFMLALTVLLAVLWVIDRRDSNDDKVLRFGYVPARWEAALRRDHPERFSDPAGSPDPYTR